MGESSWVSPGFDKNAIRTIGSSKLISSLTMIKRH